MLLSKLNKLSVKLPLFVALTIVLVAGGLSFYSYSSGRSAAVESSTEQFAVVMEKKKDTLERWYQNLESLLTSLASSPVSVEASTNLSAIWNILTDEEKRDVQTSFTSENPFAFERRIELVIADDGRGYDRLHARYHEYFADFIQTNDLYDLFIIETNGDIIYSVVKENDFGENVLTGSLADAGIGEAFRAALEGTSESVHLSRFDRYEISNGAVAAFAAVPITTAENEVRAILVVQANQAEFQALINDTTGLGATGEAFVVSSEGRLLVNSRFEGGPRALDTIEMTPEIRAALNGQTTLSRDVVGLRGESVKMQTTPLKFNGSPHALILQKTNDELFSSVNAQRNMMILISATSAAILIVFSWLYIRRITTALDQFGREMRKVSDGDFVVEISSTERKDEIGGLGSILVDFRSKLEAAEQKQQERDHAQEEQQKTLETLRSGLVQLADGDLSRPIEQKFGAEYESLRVDFNAALATLSEAISSVMEASGSIQHGAQEISQASDDLSNRTENQAATLEQTAAALDELTASVKSAAEGAKSVETIVLEAQTEAEASGKVVSNAIAAMTQIEESSKHISQIISVIDDIAFQTNLLALNAGVEAARAGDAGKGFAVVASEVRALAQRSSEAAKEIKTLISGSATEVGRGVELVGGAGAALTSIVQRVTHISELVRTMATGTAEQAVGLGEINIGVNQLDQVTQQNAAMVEQATAASHVLKGDAVRLQEMVKRFKTGNIHGGRGEPATFRRSTTPSTVQPVEFKPATEVSFTPKQGEMPIERKSTGTGGAAAADNDWIDF